MRPRIKLWVFPWTRVIGSSSICQWIETCGSRIIQDWLQKACSRICQKRSRRHHLNRLSPQLRRKGTVAQPKSYRFRRLDQAVAPMVARPCQAALKRFVARPKLRTNAPFLHRLPRRVAVAFGATAHRLAYGHSAGRITHIENSIRPVLWQSEVSPRTTINATAVASRHAAKRQRPCAQPRSGPEVA